MIPLKKILIVTLFIMCIVNIQAQKELKLTDKIYFGIGNGYTKLIVNRASTPCTNCSSVRVYNDIGWNLYALPLTLGLNTQKIKFTYLFDATFLFFNTRYHQINASYNLTNLPQKKIKSKCNIGSSFILIDSDFKRVNKPHEYYFGPNISFEYNKFVISSIYGFGLQNVSFIWFRDIVNTRLFSINLSYELYPFRKKITKEKL